MKNVSGQTFVTCLKDHSIIDMLKLINQVKAISTRKDKFEYSNFIVEEGDKEWLTITYKSTRRPPNAIKLRRYVKITNTRAGALGQIFAEGAHNTKLLKTNQIYLGCASEKIIKEVNCFLNYLFKDHKVTYYLRFPTNKEADKDTILHWKSIVKSDIKITHSKKTSKVACIITIPGRNYVLALFYIKLAFREMIKDNRELFASYIGGRFEGDGHFYLSKEMYPVFSICYGNDELEEAIDDSDLMKKYFDIDLKRQKTSSKNAFLLRTYNTLDSLKLSHILDVNMPREKILSILCEKRDLMYVSINDKFRKQIIGSSKKFSEQANLNYETVVSWKRGRNLMPLSVYMSTLTTKGISIEEGKNQVNLVQLERKGSINIIDRVDKVVLDDIVYGASNEK